MPIGINTSIKWSMTELNGLLEDEDAHVHFQRSKRHLALHPFQLNDLNKALREILSSKVNFYDSDLQGLVLAYKNPKLLGALGGILHDSHFIHVDIEADFYIFRPEVGCTLKGIANKKAGNHLGVLVHKAFNVSILKSDDCQEWLGDYVFVGQEVKFTVTHLDFKGKLPFIRGELIPDVTMGQVYYDSINNEEHEEKPTHLVVDGGNSVITEVQSKRSKKSKSLNIDNGKEENDEFSRTDENNVDHVKNGKNDTIDSSSSNDDRDGMKSPGSSMKKLLEIRARRKAESAKSSRDKRSSIELDTSEDERMRKRDKRGEETDSSVEEKPKIFASVEPIGIKQKRIESKSKSQDLDSTNRRNETDRIADNGDLDDILPSPMKRSKKNRISDSDDDVASEIDVKPDIRVKKRKKRRDEEEEDSEEEEKKKKEKCRVKKEEEEEKKKLKKKSKEKDDEIEVKRIKQEEDEERRKSKKSTKENEVKIEEEEEKRKCKKKSKNKEDKEEDTEDERKKKKKKYKNEEDLATQSDIIEFEFIKPDIDGFEVPAAKCKRKRRKTITEDDETRVISVDESSNPEDNEFLRDVRVKVEPDPSDIEDFRERKKDRKRKKRHSTSENPDDDVKKSKELVDEIGIKMEPDMSDVEEFRPKKKKSKRRTREEDSFEDVKVKIEPDASDVEESRNFKHNFKREPGETTKNRGESTIKGV